MTVSTILRMTRMGTLSTFHRVSALVATLTIATKHTPGALVTAAAFERARVNRRNFIFLLQAGKFAQELLFIHFFASRLLNWPDHAIRSWRFPASVWE
jgi:hypothetical protein